METGKERMHRASLKKTEKESGNDKNKRKEKEAAGGRTESVIC